VEVTQFYAYSLVCLRSQLIPHQRSRYVSLIDFSNKPAYNGELISFSSTVDHFANVGVEFA
jgi:hypothetical protein